MNTGIPFKLIRQPAVSELTCWPKTTLQKRIKEGLFPPPINIGQRSVAWLESEALRVVEALVAGRSKVEVKMLVAELLCARKRGE